MSPPADEAHRQRPTEASAQAERMSGQCPDDNDCLEHVELGLKQGGSLYYQGKSTVIRSSGLLEAVPDDRQVRLDFRDVSSWVPDLGAGNQHKAPPRRQTLYTVSGSALPGEMVAMMGPSGSGKTSLLSILGGRAASSITVEGSILFNNKHLGKRVKRQMGFVLQDDLLYEELTVLETLSYAAQLRLPKAMSREEKQGRVEAVIQALGLDKCRDTIIGGFMRRGVSGGERKRVSVGHEMLINPSIIFLDEPTSGLDSTTALSLVNTLHSLAEGGRTIVSTIHQPSSRMFQKLEKLVLLSEGHVLYYGRNDCCVEWFEGLGTPCPPRVNPADFLLDLASANQGQSQQEGLDIRATQVNAFHALGQHRLYSIEEGLAEDTVGLASELREEASGAEMHGAKEEPAGENGGQRLMRRMTFVASSVASLGRQGQKDSDSKSSELVEWGSSWLTQFLVLLSRAVTVRKFETLGVQNFLQLIGVAVVCGLFWWQKGSTNSVSEAQDLQGLLFFQAIFMSYTSMFGALFVFPNDIRMVIKERSSGMYRLSAYYVSRTVSDLPITCFIPTIFVIIIYFMGGLTLTAGAFMANWSTTMLTILTAQGAGLLLGAAMDVKAAQTLATVIIISTMLVSGYMIADVPVWMDWLKYFSFVYHSFNILLHIEFNGRVLEACPPSGSAPCVAVDTQTALRLPKDPNDPIGLELGLMFAMLIILRLCTYFVLSSKTKQKKH